MEENKHSRKDPSGYWCTDPPRHLKIDSAVARKPHGQYKGQNEKFPWTDELLQEAMDLRVKGIGWREIAAMLEEEVGVRLREDAVQNRVLQARYEQEAEGKI